jgi:hypothetical protein
VAWDVTRAGVYVRWRWGRRGEEKNFDFYYKKNWGRKTINQKNSNQNNKPKKLYPKQFKP